MGRLLGGVNAAEALPAMLDTEAGVCAVVVAAGLACALGLAVVILACRPLPRPVPPPLAALVTVLAE